MQSAVKNGHGNPWMGLWLGLLVTLVSWLGPVGARAQGGAANDNAAVMGFIRGIGDQAVALAANKSLKPEDRADKFHQWFVGSFDVPAIGQFTLGRYWRVATPEERQTFLGLFETMITKTYAERFSQYSGETFQVVSAKPQESGEFLVSSAVMRPAVGQPVRVEWQVKARSGQFKIEDVIIEGISMGIAQRNDFGSAIQQSGKGVAGLIEQMRKRVGR